MSDKTVVETVRTVKDLRARVKAWRQAGETVGLVPTMGALHEGHLSLVRQSRAVTDHTITTLFVNPKQFGENEDFSVYPRDETADAIKLADEGADLLFAPEAVEMYPRGSVTEVHVPGIGDLLEGEFRPGFFTGVATVVSKLLLQALPDVAIFGEKDYQQLQVIIRMAADMDIPVRIEGAPTVREADGLAMSSRNEYLSAEERKQAPELYQVLTAMAEKIAGGDAIAEIEAAGRDHLLNAGFRQVDYLSVRDAASLSADLGSAPRRILAAAWMGKTRLIDNIAA
jgi:pantoate--beta-alanine ligase